MAQSWMLSIVIWIFASNSAPCGVGAACRLFLISCFVLGWETSSEAAGIASATANRTVTFQLRPHRKLNLLPALFLPGRRIFEAFPDLCFEFQAIPRWLLASARFVLLSAPKARRMRTVSLLPGGWNLPGSPGIAPPQPPPCVFKPPELSLKLEAKNSGETFHRPDRQIAIPMCQPLSNRALLVDLYELTMAAGYFEHGMDFPATFELFVRSLPPERSYLIAAGVDDALDYLQNLRFTDDDIRYLRSLPAFRTVGGDFFDSLRNFQV